MFDLNNKCSVNAKTREQRCTIKSVLEPFLLDLDLRKLSLAWFRQPPAPYETEELTFNFNMKSYKCNSLDYQCSIICKAVNQHGKQVQRFDFGPIYTFLYNRLSTNLQLRVQVLLFNNVKKCIFSLNSTPTLINPQNNNKYQLTQQDIKSIYLKPQNSVEQQAQQINQLDQISILKSKKKKTLVVQNLFQRLILLKLFHQIPNGMYCYSIELLQIQFYDQSSCNMVLFALNRYKYQKKNPTQISKSMFNQTSQQLGKPKFMKKSNQSLSQLKANSQLQMPNLSKHLSADEPRKQMLTIQVLSSFKKSPKDCTNSANKSILSGNSSKAAQSKASFILNQNAEQSRNYQNQINQYASSPGSAYFKSRISIKKPKISVLSTEINSIKGLREQKSSFPYMPVQGLHLKYSELLIGPKDSKCPLSLRRSQDQIKTPRMDGQGQQINISPQMTKKKSVSAIQEPIKDDQLMQQSEYVNEFQSLLFEGENQNQDNELMCLNDSFIRMQQDEKLNDPMILSIKSSQRRDEISLNLPMAISASSPTKSQRNLISLKQKLIDVLQQNYDLKQKNQELKRQIEEAKSNSSKKKQPLKYQEEIKQIKLIHSSLIQLNQHMKKFPYPKQKLSQPKQKQSQPQQKRAKQLNSQVNTGLSAIIYNKQAQIISGVSQKRILQFSGHSGFVILPRQSKHEQDFIPQNQAYIQLNSGNFAGRRSQNNEYSSFFVNRQVPFINRQASIGVTQHMNGQIFSQGQSRFMKFQQDAQYQKFRNNQSYSYKVTQNKNEEWKPAKDSFFRH